MGCIVTSQCTTPCYNIAPPGTTTLMLGHPRSVHPESPTGSGRQHGNTEMPSCGNASAAWVPHGGSTAVSPSPTFWLGQQRGAPQVAVGDAHAGPVPPGHGRQLQALAQRNHNVPHAQPQQTLHHGVGQLAGQAEGRVGGMREAWNGWSVSHWWSGGRLMRCKS